MTAVHKDIKAFLNELGLTPTEISLYIAGLRYRQQTVTELAKRSGIKRTTTQSAIATLIEKGMMSAHAQSGAMLYMAVDPELIDRRFIERIDMLKQQRLDFINILPLFDDVKNTSVTTTEVTSFHGLEGVKTAVDTALFCVSRQWKIIAPERNFFSEIGTEYAKYFISIRKKRGIRAQSLWEPSFVAKRTFDETAFEFRNPRVLPKELAGRFTASIIIFDNSVLFITSASEMSAVLIRSTEIHQIMGLFFNGVWANAKEIPKRRKV
jgi:sugar-specific transcriptional regulator TrmB